tara:strand:+ start:7681 stop:8712 length:1032 start_codon:yes stop_codon:yes gene_type:complete
MKIGFIAPNSIAAVNGGLRTQALLTARHLKELEVEVIFISPWDTISSKDIDLFHIFSASIENHGIVSRLYEQNKKIVLSPVLFSNRKASNIRRLLNIEEKLTSISSGIRSEFAQKKEICEKADLVLPNTTAEGKLIHAAFSISDSKIKVIPNGVEKRFIESNATLFEEKMGFKDFVLFAGQSSAPRKNVLTLLEAFQGIDEKLVIIGDFSNSKYSKKCVLLAEKNPNIYLLNTLEHDSELLSSAYAACKVFVLPSQFETPGISAMEAALAGANIVITEVGGPRDYFEEYANYVSPFSKSSIKTGIQKALKKPKTENLQTHILQNYTWDKVAEQTLIQYKRMLK